MEKCVKCRKIGLLNCKYCSSIFCTRCIQHDCKQKILELKTQLEKALGSYKPIRHGIDDT